MVEIGVRYQSVRSGGWVEVVARDEKQLTFQRLYRPRTGKLAAHCHLDFTQTWEAIEGEGTIELDGERRPLRAGDRVVIEPGRAHRDPYVPADGELLVKGTFNPPSPFIEAYAEAWVHHLRQGTVNAQDELPLLQVLQIGHATAGKTYATGLPRGLQDATLPLLASIARLRGYRARYDRP